MEARSSRLFLLDWQKIWSQYERLLADISEDSSVELEVRFQAYRGNRTFDINRAQYEMMLRALDEEVRPEGLITSVEELDLSDISFNASPDNRDDVYRMRDITKPGSRTVYYSRKVKRPPVESLQYGLRVALSTEVELSAAQWASHDFDEERGHKRHQIRRSYLMKSGSSQIDISSIDADGSDGRSEKRYELEVELMPGGNSADFLSDLRMTFLLLHETDNIYSLDERAAILAQLNKTLSGGRVAETRYLDIRFVPTTRNLKRLDLQFGAIVGNKTKFPDRVATDGDLNVYQVTLKADGLRAFVAFNEVGAWIVKTKTLNLVYRNNFISYSQTVFDGEYIPNSMRRYSPSGERYGVPTDNLFLVFDLVSDIDMPSNATHTLRLEHSQVITNGEGGLNYSMKSNPEQEDSPFRMHFSYKTVRPIFDFNGFFASCNELLNTAVEADLPYSVDGLIFTPDFMPYRNFASDEPGPAKIVYLDSGKEVTSPRELDIAKAQLSRGQSRKYGWRAIPLSERILSEVPDTCKWKPQVTIDLAVERRMVDDEGDVYDLQAYDSSIGQLVPFRGDSKIGRPWRPTQLVKSQLLLEADHKSILEFAWLVPSEHPDLVSAKEAARWPVGEKALLAVKPRPDKTGPNDLDIAVDNWAMIVHPLTVQDIRGRSIGFVRAFHNRLKRQLYQAAIDALGGDAGKLRILDIGTGRFGDKRTLSRFAKIFAVEPNLQNVEEIKARTRDEPELAKKLTVIPVGGEQSAKIAETLSKEGGKVDIVSLMLSLSFFWQSPDMLDALANTINSNLKPGGVIIFMSLDGDALYQQFRPYRNTCRRLNRLELGPIVFDNLVPGTASTGYRITTTIPDSILSDVAAEGERGTQTEYLPFLGDLFLKLSEYELNWMHSAEPLAREGRIYAPVFMSGHEAQFSRLYSYGLLQGFGGDETLLSPISLDLEEEGTIVPSKARSSVLLNRYSVLDEGSSLFHALARALYEDYMSLSPDDRRARVRDLRQIISEYVSDEDRWRQLLDGRLVDLAAQAEADPGAYDYLDLGPAGLADLIGSDDTVPSIIYDAIAQILGKKIVMINSRRRILAQYGTADESIVMIETAPYHYELVGLKPGPRYIFTRSELARL